MGIGAERYETKEKLKSWRWIFQSYAGYALKWLKACLFIQKCFNFYAIFYVSARLVLEREWEIYCCLRVWHDCCADSLLLVSNFTCFFFVCLVCLFVCFLFVFFYLFGCFFGGLCFTFFWGFFVAYVYLLHLFVYLFLFGFIVVGVFWDVGVVLAIILRIHVCTEDKTRSNTGKVDPVLCNGSN